MAIRLTSPHGNSGESPDASQRPTTKSQTPAPCQIRRLGALGNTLAEVTSEALEHLSTVHEHSKLSR